MTPNSSGLCSQAPNTKEKWSILESRVHFDFAWETCPSPGGSEPWRHHSTTGSRGAFCGHLTLLWECPECWRGSLHEGSLCGSPKNVLTGVSVFYTASHVEKAYVNTPLVCFLVPASCLSSFCPCSLGREMRNNGITDSSELNEQVWMFLQVSVVSVVQYRSQVMSLNAVSQCKTSN